MTTPTPREALAELVACEELMRSQVECFDKMNAHAVQDAAYEEAQRMSNAWQAARAALAVPPFERESWQHAVDDQLVGHGKTSEEFATPREAVAWLLNAHAETAVALAVPSGCLAEVQPPEPLTRHIEMVEAVDPETRERCFRPKEFEQPQDHLAEGGRGDVRGETGRGSGVVHVGECATDEISRQVCEDIYKDRCDDNLALCEALRAVYALVGEDKAVKKIVHDAIRQYGIDDA